jgi:AraC-like DNA-binding protein
MVYRLTGTDVITLPSTAGPGWQRSHIPEELGVGYVDRLPLAGGLSVAYSSYTPDRDLAEESVMERDTHSLTITIALQGRSVYRGRDGSAFDFLGGHTTVTAFRSSNGERRYLANEAVRQWRLIADAQVLRAYGLEHLLASAREHQGAHQLFHDRSSGAIQRLADTFTHLYTSARSPLDLQIAALTVLSEQARQIAPPSHTPGWHARDEEPILQAREILLRHYDRALSVPYLCAAVGTNEFKLKQGFRALFGTSPHRMLIDIRMRKAWELLESGEYVSRVAYKVGFQHPSSFSAAFERYFGRTPKSVSGTARN